MVNLCRNKLTKNRIKISINKFTKWLNKIKKLQDNSKTWNEKTNNLKITSKINVRDIVHNQFRFESQTSLRRNQELDSTERMLPQDLLSLESHKPPPGTCPTLFLSPTRRRHTEIPILEPIHALSTDYSDYKFTENIHCISLCIAFKKSVNMFLLYLINH